jgi:hypothetical protein
MPTTVAFVGPADVLTCITHIAVCAAIEGIIDGYVYFFLQGGYISCISAIDYDSPFIQNGVCHWNFIGVRQCAIHRRITTIRWRVS